MKLKQHFTEFYRSEKSIGIILLTCAIISIVIANTIFGDSYSRFWQLSIAGMSIEHWINDGLMAIFFLYIGLELERELYTGELSSKKKAVLPFFAALGGMIIPLGIYLFFNYGKSTQSAAGIPMATDIAFALGIISLLGKKIPASLRIFLMALAIIDDLGAIIVISIFYTSAISWLYLSFAALIAIVLIVLNKRNVQSLIPYILGGCLMWFFMLNSGIHATITGVILAFIIPFKRIKEQSPSETLLRKLHKSVPLIILPIFALANTAIILNSGTMDLFSSSLGIGIAAGLILGKPLGIFSFTYVAVQFGVAKLPSHLNWNHIFGAGLLGGIGFTMSIFIAILSFEDVGMLNGAKTIILVSSLIAGSLGFWALKWIAKVDK